MIIELVNNEWLWCYRCFGHTIKKTSDHGDAYYKAGYTDGIWEDTK